MSENKKATPIRRRRRKGLRAIKKLLRFTVVLAIVLVAGAFALKAYITNQAAGSGEETVYNRAIVQRGAMEETVYGTGITSARSQPNVLAGADGTLTDLRVSIGDEVSKGDILAVISNDTLDDTITDLEFALWDLDATIAGTGAGSKVTVVESPVAGMVKALYAKAGDDALAVFRREGALAVISTDGRMKVELRGENRALPLALDERVTVSGVGLEADGKAVTIQAEGTVVDLTRQGTEAVITIIDDKYPMGTQVTVTRENGEVVGTGILQVNKPMAVSSFGGTIQRVRVKIGDTVKRRDTLFWLEDPPLTLTMEDLRLQREAAAKELADAKEQRENLIVLAPCDGVIATLDAAEGDEITAGMLLGSILQGEEMNLTIAVDELDVVEVEIGQPVTITVDALGSMQLSGEVHKIAPVGANSGGVTTYNVELTLDAAGSGVRSGMNATGEIQVAAKADTLFVPVEALMTINNKSYVMVAGVNAPIPSAMDPEAARGSRQGGAAQRGDTDRMGGMAQNGGMPSGLLRDEAAGMSGADEGTEDAQQSGLTLNSVTAKIKAVAQRVKAWLYEDVPSGQPQEAGSLVPVEVGMRNDEYAEILSGVSEGDVLLYTGGGESGYAFGGRSGSRGGMPMGGMMGF